MVTRIADDLGWCVKAHRLRIEKGGAEDIRMMAFEPGRGIGDQRKRGRVAFRKTIAAKPLQLPKRLLGIRTLIAMRDHAGDQLVAEFRDAAGMFEGRHASSELISFAWCKARTSDGDTHGLLLEQRDAQRFAEHFFQFGFGIDHLLLALAAAQIGMHHVALDRAWPDDRHFDDEIIKSARLDPRQHRHLRATLDLKRAERVRLADHRIGLWILGRDGGEIEPDALVLGEQIKTALHAREHAKRQAIYLHKVQGRRYRPCPTR